MKKWLVVIHVFQEIWDDAQVEFTTHIIYSCEYETENISPANLTELKSKSCKASEIAVVHQIIPLS
jgi:hypothetical protein